MQPPINQKTREETANCGRGFCLEALIHRRLSQKDPRSRLAKEVQSEFKASLSY